MTINLTQAKKEQILDNMIQLHSNMSEAECVDIRSYCFFSKQLLKLVEKIYKKSPYLVTPEDGDGGEDPP